jgi:hypothetical protein
MTMRPNKEASWSQRPCSCSSSSLTPKSPPFVWEASSRDITPGTSTSPQTTSTPCAALTIGTTASRSRWPRPTSPLVDDVARGIIALQTGTVPAALYATEPTGAGAFASTGAQQLSIVREAWGGATLARGLTLDAGVFLSPVGFDGAAAKDNRFWSLSNLGVGLPFYLTGVRLSAPLGENTTLTGGVFNGWNRIFDDNEGKTVGLWVDHQFAQGARLHALYIGGAEGAGDRPWRHTVDVWADLPPRPGESLGRRDRRARATRGRPGALRGGAARGERAGDGVLGRWRPSRRVPRGRQRRRSRRDLLANVVARRGDRRRDAPARAGGDRAA